VVPNTKVEVPVSNPPAPPPPVPMLVSFEPPDAPPPTIRYEAVVDVDNAPRSIFHAFVAVFSNCKDVPGLIFGVALALVLPF
jgi:hypothetical protein